MSGAKAAKKKQSLWQTLRAASGPYRRLFGYVKPQVRFIVGLLLALLRRSQFTFTARHCPGDERNFPRAAPNPMALRSNLESWIRGRKSIRLFSSVWPFRRS
jgi:hypothetical protein